MRLLLKAGAPVNQANVTGTTPLMNAATNGNHEAVKLLLSAGADVNAQSGPPSAQVKNGMIDLARFTPLILASAYGPAAVVKTLLDAGANVNAKESRGMTALMYAAATDHGDIEIARLLMARGADLNVKSNAGETALDWANKMGPTPLAALLKKAGAPTAAGPARCGRGRGADRAAAGDRARRRAARTLVRHLFHQRRLRIVPRAEASPTSRSRRARKRGIAVSEAGRRPARGGRVHDSSRRPRPDSTSASMVPSIDILLYTLAGFAASDYPPDRATDVLVFNVATQQRRDGRWYGGGVPRPPIEDGDFTRTALSIRALTSYAPPGRMP